MSRALHDFLQARLTEDGPEALRIARGIVDDTLRMLAFTYSSHPDWRETWRPSPGMVEMVLNHVDADRV